MAVRQTRGEEEEWLSITPSTHRNRTRNDMNDHRSSHRRNPKVPIPHTRTRKRYVL